MDPVRKEDIDPLLRVCGPTCISIFLATHRGARETKQNPIRFRNLIKRADDALVEMGVSLDEQRALLGPLHDLANDHDFWQHQDDGLAVLRSPHVMRRFRVPAALEELVVVEDRFHVKPLLAFLNAAERFFVLELHVHRVRLFEADRFGIAERDLGDAPRRLEDTVGYEVRQQMVQQHSIRSGTPAGGLGAQGAGPTGMIFHGHGEGEPEEEKREIRQWFGALHDAVDRLVGDRQVPVVLVGSEPLFPIFRAMSALNVLEEGVHEKNEPVSEREIHAHAWPVAERYLTREVDEAPERLPALEGRGLASTDLDEVLLAAFDGRVRTLYVGRDEHEWGRFDVDHRAVRRFDGWRPGADDLLDLAAANTYAKGGKVWVLPHDRLPAGTRLAAEFRY